MKKYVLSGAYKTPPLFVSEEIDDKKADLLNLLGVSKKPYRGPINFEDLDLSKTLIDALKCWDAKYQATFCASDPKSSGFECYEAESEYHNEGKKLCLLLKEELGTDVSVKYEG